MLESMPNNKKSQQQTSTTLDSSCGLPATTLGERLREWAQKRDWKKFRVVTHRFAFRRKFGKELCALVLQKETGGQKLLALRITEFIETFGCLCDKIDKLTSKKCESEDDLEELEAAKDKAKSAIMALAELVETGVPVAASSRKRRWRSAASKLSPREQRIWALVQVQGKTLGQAAIELDCSRQNISKHLKSAEEKMKAQRSRSVASASGLSHDNRGQVCIAAGDAADN